MEQIYTSNSDSEELKNLSKAKEFEKLSNLIDLKTFNIFRLFEQDICENTISRLLRFLFASEEVHGLKDIFFREWIKIVAPNIGLTLPRAHCQIESIFNWNTPEGRYIDIVVQIKNRSENNLIFVAGIETKIFACEQKNQISDYQGALSKTFNCPVHMFFLTPDGHDSNTATRMNAHCKCSIVSFSTLIPPLLAISQRVKKKNKYSSLSLFIESFSEYLKQNILPGGDMRSQTNELIRKLEEKYPKAISIIRSTANHLVTSRSLIYENVLPKLQDQCTSVKVVWHYPKTHRSPWEFNISTNDLEELSVLLSPNKQLRLFFQFITVDRENDVGKGTTLMLQLVIHKFSTVSNKVLGSIEELRHVLAPHKSDPQQWNCWICLWGAGSFTLKNLTEKDSDKLTDLFLCSYKHALPKLKRAIKKIKHI
jgi:hypothetical protein